MGGSSPAAGAHPQGVVGPPPSPLTASEPRAGRSHCRRSYRAGWRLDAGPPPELRRQGGHCSRARPTGLHGRSPQSPEPHGVSGIRGASGAVARQPWLCFDQVSQVFTNGAELQAPWGFTVGASLGAFNTSTLRPLGGSVLPHLPSHPQRPVETPGCGVTAVLGFTASQCLLSSCIAC